MWRRFRTEITFTLFGTLAGLLLLHPYTMLAEALIHIHKSGELHFHWSELNLQIPDFFRAAMLPMSVSFALFSGAIGLLVGIVVDRKRKLLTVRFESEKQKVALTTLKELMVTLSHHLLNSNMIIGGKVRHCRKLTSDEEMLTALQVIEQQGRKIDAVIKALRDLTEIKEADYTTNGQVRMLDIGSEIEDQLRHTQNQ